MKRKEYLKYIDSEYKKKFAKSNEAYQNGKDFFPNGVAQLGRFTSPFPPFIEKASKSIITTIDGEELIDYWQGHFINILGHSPACIKTAILNCINKDFGLQLGIYSTLEAEVAELLKNSTGFDNFIYTTSGTLATMYAIILGLAYTNKPKVLKIAGGWHGVQPWALKGVKYPQGLKNEIMECAGIPSQISDNTINTPFNDTDKLEEVFKVHGNNIGVFILELVLGNSGMLVASKIFVQKARELSNKYGVVLVVDEIVTGFRINAGLMSSVYNIKPDITVLGKALSGGMPFACLAMNREISTKVSIASKLRVGIDAGTFTSHPLTLVAVKQFLNYIINNEDKIYSRIITTSNYYRSQLSKIFSKVGIAVHITGESQDKSVPNFPIGTVRYLKDSKNYCPQIALSHWDKKTVDIELRDQICRKALMLKGIYPWQGFGVVTIEHTKKIIEFTLSKYNDFVNEISNIEE